jgi:protein phosphatase
MTSFIGTDGLSYAPGNAQHRGGRDQQQDSFGFSDPADRDFMNHGGLLAVVADGIGGMADGADASRIAVHTFLQSYAAKDQAETVGHALRRALETADQAVFQFARRGKHQGGIQNDAGSTLVAAALAARRLFWTSVGDSAIYLYRHPQLTLLNNPHTLGAQLDRMAQRGEISPDDVKSSPDRDALTSYVGAGGLAEVDAEEEGTPVVAGDLLLLCTDGLFRALDPGDIAGVLDSTPNSQSACDALIARTLARALPHQDNVTVLCIRIDEV